MTFLKGEKNKDEDTKVTLGIHTQLCRQYFQRIAAELPHDEADACVGQETFWLKPYPAMSKAVAGLDRDVIVKPEADGSTCPTLTLLVKVDWPDLKIEQAVLARANEYLLKEILERGSTYEKHHLCLEPVTKITAAWLDKDEKWSTYVKRLLAEDELKRAKERKQEENTDRVQST